MSKQKNIKTGAAQQVLARLAAKQRPERTKRTLVLTKALYEEFEIMCRKRDLYPSDVVDEFISLYVETQK